MTRDSLTPRQHDILTHLFRFRFLTRIHIQDLLNHANHTRINSWLNDLTTNNYIGRIYSQTFSENIKPAIYYLKLKGLQLIAEEHSYPKSLIRNRYRDHERSREFIDRCLFLSDISLKLLKQNRHGHNVESPLYEPVPASVLPVSHLQTLIAVSPDLVIQKKSKGEVAYFVLKLLKPNQPATALRSEFRSLTQYYFSGEWEETQDATFPIFLYICPSTSNLISTKWLVRSILEENQNPEDLHVRLATHTDVQQSGITAEIWEVVH